MKKVLTSWGILILTYMLFIGSSQPRLIKGTVYSKEGQRVAGVIVTADKSRGKYYTSFDGYYEINANNKSKWIKFTFQDRVEKLKIEGITRDVIDFGKNIEWVKSDSIKRKEKIEFIKVNKSH